VLSIPGLVESDTLCIQLCNCVQHRARDRCHFERRSWTTGLRSSVPNSPFHFRQQTAQIGENPASLAPLRTDGSDGARQSACTGCFTSCSLALLAERRSGHIRDRECSSAVNVVSSLMSGSCILQLMAAMPNGLLQGGLSAELTSGPGH
jgi:hypothetical protein